MTGQLTPALAAVVLALLLGGSLRGFTQPIARWPLGLAAVVTDLVLARMSPAGQPWIAVWGHWLWVGTIVGVLLVLLENARRNNGRARLPWAVASLGVALNLAVILANSGYMPISKAGLLETGQATVLTEEHRYRRSVEIGPNTPLALLGDILVEPAFLPMKRSVLSIGDVLLSIGLATWAFQVTYTARPARRRLEPETAWAS